MIIENDHPYLPDTKPVPRFLMYILAIKIQSRCPIPNIIKASMCPCRKNQQLTGQIDFCHSGSSFDQLIEKHLFNDE